MQPMTPQNNYTVDVTGSSAQTTIATGQNQIRFFNAGAVIVFYEIGSNPTAAVATSTPLFPGNEVTFTKDANATKLAMIGASAGPTTVYVTTGQGL